MNLKLLMIFSFISIIKFIKFVTTCFLNYKVSNITTKISPTYLSENFDFKYGFSIND